MRRTWLLNISKLASIIFFTSAFGIELSPKFFADLGNEEFRVREVAQVQLLELAKNHHDESLNEIYTQSQTSKEPEVRARCMVILRQLVMEQYMQEGSGFVGIVRDNRLAVIPGKQKPCHVVAVNGVGTGTPSDRAGIKINDLIVSLNGVGWLEQDASAAFGNQIAALKPGTKAVLEILRDGTMIDVQVVLTRRPLSAELRFFGEQGVDPGAADRAAMENYFREWLNQRKLRY